MGFGLEKLQLQDVWLREIEVPIGSIVVQGSYKAALIWSLWVKLLGLGFRVHKVQRLRVQEALGLATGEFFARPRLDFRLRVWGLGFRTLSHH